MEKLDTIVIGAGVIGLAIARALAYDGREVVVLEKNTHFGMETSSRNSEVIHAGIYYQADSLKARASVAGKRRLYQYCEEKNIPHRKLGKLIVAVEETELPVLKDYLNKGRVNGVEDLRLLSQAETRELEPDIKAVGALLSPSTGIIDSHAFMLNLVGDIESKGAAIAYCSPVIEGSIQARGFVLRIGGNSDVTVRCRTLINAAGLHAPSVASAVGVPSEKIPRAYYAKGHYFTLSGPVPFNHLIYPIATAAGLGTHLTLDLNNQARFGPDVQWIDNIDYSFDESRRDSFAQAIHRYYPELKEELLTPSYTGIRPKIAGPDSPTADFRVDGPKEHGIPGLVNLFGIESPGLTASLEIADIVKRALSVSNNSSRNCFN